MGILQSVSLLALFLQAPAELDVLVVGQSEAAVEAARLKLGRVGYVGEELVRVPVIRSYRGYQALEWNEKGLLVGRGAMKVRLQARVVIDATEGQDVLKMVEGSPEWCLVEGKRCLKMGGAKLIGAANEGKLAVRLAQMALKNRVEPRDMVKDAKRVLELQLGMVREGIELWPYRDVTAKDPWFEAANLLAARGVLVGGEEFRPNEPVLRKEMYLALLGARLGFTAGRGEGNRAATRRDLYDALREAGLSPAAELAGIESKPMLRHELATHLWNALRDSLQSPPPSRP